MVHSFVFGGFYMIDITVVITVISSIVAVVSAIMGVYYAVQNNKRAETHETEEETKSNATVLLEIGYIKSGIDDLKVQQRKQDERYISLASRVTAVEASAKQAHHRIDRLEGVKQND